MAQVSSFPSGTPNIAASPTIEVFDQRYGINGPARRVSRELYERLLSASPDSSLAERVAWLEGILEWVLTRSRPCDLYGAEGLSDTRTARFTFLVAVLSREPELASRIRELVGSLLREGSIVRLLCSTGLPCEAGFFGELSSRLASAVLPEAPDDSDLARPLQHAFRRDEDVEWLSSLEDSRVAALAAVILGPEALEEIRRQCEQALSIIATRVAALGLSDHFAYRAGDIEPFIRLSRGTHDLEVIAACRDACQRVRTHLEDFGVSTDLVFRLESIHQGLDRCRALLERTIHPGSALLASVLNDAHRQRSVRALVTASSRQLARKIVERSGTTGHHYITESRREWFGMLGSAAGGGVLTSGTTFLKYLVGWLGLPLFIEGSANAVNYAGSFLLMQMVGFTLATKQPSMTAAALARALEEDGASDSHESLVDLVARMVRSQLAAVLGNIGFVIPACLALDLLHEQLTGRTFLDAYAGSYVVKSLHPTQSGTIFYAALTGVLLWLSSICAGWLDNWVAFRRLPDAVAHHKPLRSLIGPGAAAWLGRTIGRAAAGFAGCVSLGVFLGVVPLASKLFGLPIDVRHVTLSTGGLALAFRGLGADEFLAAGGLAAIAGIGVIGALNFGISFACALVVAVRARDIAWRGHLRLALSLLGALVQRPVQFFLPPRSPS